MLKKPLPPAPSTPSKTVNFSGNQDNEKKREKFLTAKYGAHQMALIRKRLRVEMWMYDQLQTLYTGRSRGLSIISHSRLEDSFVWPFAQKKGLF